MSAAVTNKGDMTPRAVTTKFSAPTNDTTQIMEMVDMMKATLGTLGETFKTLNEQSEKVTALAPTMEAANEQIYIMRKQIRSQDMKTEARVNSIKELISSQLKSETTKQLSEYIKEEIHRELSAKVKEQVHLQMPEHLPVSLEEQLKESHTQLIEVKHALMNSESRRANSDLRTDNLNDQLAPVLKPDGTRSDVYPHSLNSLFAYTDEILHRLLYDHDLTVHTQREKNLNRFMAHIGVGFRLVPIPDTPGVNEAREDTCVSPI